MHPGAHTLKPLDVGQPAPDFALNDTGLTLHALIRREQRPALVYFYPVDFSPVCTAQACMVRDLSAGGGPIPIGISPQSGAMHEKFRKARGLTQILISDPGRAIARLYGAAGPFGTVRRVSFLVATDALIADRASGLFTLGAHRRLIERYTPGVA